MAGESSPITHDHLRSVCRELPQGYTPYGQEPRWVDPQKNYDDCSCGCKWFAQLEGSLGMDWGVCANPASHRCGLLTFEHQGCFAFEPSPSALLEGP